MKKKNKEIILSKDEVFEVLKEVEIILQSLHHQGSYYFDKNVQDYQKETTDFIDDWLVTCRLAKIRGILSSKFNEIMDDNEMEYFDELFENIKHWNKPGDKADKDDIIQLKKDVGHFDF